MMGNLHWHNNDPLENQIRQTVQDWESAPPADWDTPPDALWHKIAPPPPAAKGLLHFWKWMAGGAALVLFASLAILISQPAAENQDAPAPQTGLHESAANSAPQPAIQDAPTTGNSGEPQSTQTDENMFATVSHYASDTETNHTDALATRKKKNNLTPAGISTPPMSQKEPVTNRANATPEANDASMLTPPPGATGNQIMEGSSAENAMTENLNTTTATPLSSAYDPIAAEPGAFQKAFAPVDRLSILSLSELDAPSAVPAALGAAPHKVKPVSGGSRFFVGAMISPNRTFRTIQSSRPANELPAYLKENEFAAWTTEFGARAGWMPNRRWAVTTGLGVYAMQQQSSHQFRIKFDPGRERPVGEGQLAGAYHLTIPSSYGDAHVEVRMQRNPNNLPITPGQFINVEMQTTTEIRYVTVPLNVHYFVTAGRWSAGLKGGLAMNFLQGQQFSAVSKVGQRGLATRVIAVDRRVENIRRVVPDFQLGAALWYRPHPGWLLSLEPTYRQGLQPVIERPAFNINQYAWGLQLGVQKVF
jgi:hypothetical protein